jgi:hypothetical protein
LNKEESEAISPFEALDNLVASIGDATHHPADGKGCAQRIIHEPAAAILTDENINENIIVDTVTKIFSETHKNFLFKSRVNLWDFLQKAQEPLKLLEEYENPFQPDIDLLYCQSIEGQLQSPIVAAEIKLFSKGTGYGKLIPKTSSWGGYYAGLDEAIALLDFGIDYVYLWHLFVYPVSQISKISKRYGDNLANKVSQSRYAYSDFLAWKLATLIALLELPIGYIQTYLIIENNGYLRDKATNEFKKGIFGFIQPYNRILQPKLNLLAHPKNRIRNLILNHFGIEEIEMRFLWKECLKCKRVFNPQNADFKYCPLCGAKLSEE